MGDVFPALSNLARSVKDYWFLITVALSALASLFYMVVFQVTPLDKYSEIRARRRRVGFHTLIGYDLLARAHYQQAKTEFERALSLDAVSHPALDGRHLAELFLAFDDPEWDASAGLAVQRNLSAFRPARQSHLQHFVEKYLGDLEARIYNPDGARVHYDKALALEPAYPDALYSYGWFHYSSPADTKAMERLFRKMTEVDEYDYRGFHGLGYALYMQALNDEDLERRAKLIDDAARQSSKASRLMISQLNIVMDLGEVARSADPETSLWFHGLAKTLLDDPVLGATRNNRSALKAQLLTSPDVLSVAGLTQRRAWVTYQLALDHLALHRRGAIGDHSGDHERLLVEARALDADEAILPIYKDQLTILDRLLPGPG